jgi:hypothetical protein
MTNVAVFDPAGICTLEGTVAAALLSLNVTVTISAATPLSVTVPVDGLPPVTILGLTETELNAGGFTVMVPDVRVRPL